MGRGPRASKPKCSMFEGGQTPRNPRPHNPPPTITLVTAPAAAPPSRRPRRRPLHPPPNSPPITTRIDPQGHACARAQEPTGPSAPDPSAQASRRAECRKDRELNDLPSTLCPLTPCHPTPSALSPSATPHPLPNTPPPLPPYTTRIDPKGHTCAGARGLQSPSAQGSRGAKHPGTRDPITRLLPPPW